MFPEPVRSTMCRHRVLFIGKTRISAQEFGHLSVQHFGRSPFKFGLDWILR